MNIIWDLDGTLVDSMPIIARAMNQTRLAFGLSELSLSTLKPFIGPSIHHTFATFLGTDDTDRVEAAVQFYRSCYDKEMTRSPVFPGVESVLGELDRAGCRQFVATAKYDEVARRLLEAVGLAHWFIEVYGSKASGERGHKPDLLAYLVQQEGLRPSETLMIGDTQYDMVAARAQNLTAIGVTWGYGEPPDLVNAGAHSLVASPDELLHTIKQTVMCSC